MDKDHRLDAPNNDTLKNIEQVSDRSELSTLYFRQRKEWDGKALLSDDERNAKREEDQRAIVTSARTEFLRLGTLIPTPAFLLVIMIAWATTFLNAENIRFTLPLALLAVAVWGISSFLSIKKVMSILYSHALRSLPFLFISIIPLSIGAHISYTLTQPVHTESFLLNTVIVGAGAYMCSIVLCAVQLFIWTSPKLRGNAKLGWMTFVVALLTIIAVTLAI